MLAEVWGQYKPNINNFSKFERKNSPLPPLDFECLDIQNLTSENRSKLNTPIPLDGVATSVLSYRGKIGQVLSLNDPTEEIWEIVQLQGTRKRGYRINTSLKTTQLWADIIENSIPLAKETGVYHLTIPNPYLIRNITNASNIEEVLNRYRALAQILGMKFSKELNGFIRDI